MPSDGSIEINVVGAIRFALEGAADDASALALIRALIDQAPETEPTDTESVRLFVATIRALRGHVVVPGRIEVPAEGPEGAEA